MKRYINLLNIIYSIIWLLYLLAWLAILSTKGYGAAGTLTAVIGWLLGTAIVIVVKHLWDKRAR